MFTYDSHANNVAFMWKSRGQMMSPMLFNEHLCLLTVATYKMFYFDKVN